MKILNATYRLTVPFLLILTGCLSKLPPGTSPREVGSGEQSVMDSAVVDSRGFDPLELEVDRVIVPETYKVTTEIRGRYELNSSDSSSADAVDNHVVGLPDEIDSVNSQAYRIQIYTSKLYGDAKQALRVAEEIFDRPVFVDYEVPNFKVRVGNFADREKAEEYEQRVKAAGYTTAWVVMVTVNITQADPLYDEGQLDQLDIEQVDSTDTDADNE